MSPVPEPTGRTVYVTLGFARQRQVRRILELAGCPVRPGWPRAGDRIAVWGQSRHAARGQAIAARTNAGLIRVEDAFLRSVHPGRTGEPPLGLLIDRQGVHFDASAPSDLETLLASHPLDDPGLIRRATDAIARLRESHLSKYSACDPALACPDPGYVLVIDQTRGDASLRASQAGQDSFARMLAQARADHPGAPVVIKTHPETAAGHRSGHFGPGDAPLITDPISPWPLLQHARAVYTLSSQIGFEAILAGQRPVVFGRPFYAGWGLSDDRHPLPMPRRGRPLTAPQLFAAAMILYPVWYDPHGDRLCALEQVLALLEARSRAWREDRRGWVASGMRLWKRPMLQRMFGAQKRVRFGALPPTDGRRHMVWAGKAPPGGGPFTRIEDGFLRSRGLGAELVPALSLVADDLGIYYDPSHESRLERLIALRETLRPDQHQRAACLIRSICALGLSKYNLGHGTPDLPQGHRILGHRILVPGQVEDDASIRLGAGPVTTNLALLQAARDAHPEAVLLYKPHPDVESGLRPGAVAAEELARLGAHPLPKADPAQLLKHVDEVWTMTSLMGFEALLRGVPVTTLGAPFYAGWGLGRDLGPVPARRRARPSLEGLVHATLIDYPRYHDPQLNAPCPPEVILERLAGGDCPHPGALNRGLSKLQGLLASHARIWR